MCYFHRKRTIKLLINQLVSRVKIDCWWNWSNKFYIKISQEIRMLLSIFSPPFCTLCTNRFLFVGNILDHKIENIWQNQRLHCLFLTLTFHVFIHFDYYYNQFHFFVLFALLFAFTFSFSFGCECNSLILATGQRHQSKALAKEEWREWEKTALVHQPSNIAKETKMPWSCSSCMNLFVWNAFIFMQNSRNDEVIWKGAHNERNNQFGKITQNISWCFFYLCLFCTCSWIFGDSIQYRT